MKISKANALQERLQNKKNKKITVKSLLIEKGLCVICYEPTDNDFVCSLECGEHPDLIENILNYTVKL